MSFHLFIFSLLPVCLTCELWKKTAGSNIKLIDCVLSTT